jgi:hypothetical protein
MVVPWIRFSFCAFFFDHGAELLGLDPEYGKRLVRHVPE